MNWIYDMIGPAGMILSLVFAIYIVLLKRKIARLPQPQQPETNTEKKFVGLHEAIMKGHDKINRQQRERFTGELFPDDPGANLWEIKK